MISQTTYISRRQGVENSFARNRNTVRHTKRDLGPISRFVIIGMLAGIFGLFSTVSGTQATSFDYEISSVDSEITEMSAKLDDLAVEKARLTSIANAKNSTVAANMEDATVSGYATE